jgi:prevent-host-death family protein
MGIEVGAFEAKTHLSKLLHEVKHGKSFTITIRGEPVAELIPVVKTNANETQEAILAMQTVKKVKGVDPAELSDWIAEGRR